MGRVEIAIVTHLSAAVAFLLLVMMIVLGGRRNRASFLLLATCLAIGGWAVAIALSLWTSGEIYPPIELLELGRNGLAIIFILLVIDRTGGDLVMARLLPLLALGVIGFAAVVRWQAPLTGYLEDIQLRYCGLSLAVLGLMSIENLVRNTHADRRWSIKFLALGLGVLFAYDIVLYSATILYQRIDWLLWVARGFVDMFAAPLIALTLARNPTLAINVHVSRQVVFHMTTLLISGIYLLALSLAGFYIRDFGGDWGSVLKISLGIGSAILGAILLTSGTARSRLKEFINTNFFSYKYDYRREWLRMIDALSSLGSLERLEERVIKALGDIVDSPAGGLWLSDEESATFRLAAGWNWARRPKPPLAAANALVERLREERADLLVATLAEIDDAATREWIAALGPVWLIVPLVARERLIGMVVLAPPRVSRELGWEDYQLLRTAGLQLASYLAEDEATRALVDAQQLKEFNKTFTFVIHDLKNVASQLGLLLKNAEKHGDNPDFQKDLMQTIRNSVERMNRLLSQLGSHRGAPGAARAQKLGPVPLRPLVQELIAGWPRSSTALSLAAEPSELTVRADAERLRQALTHVVQNAVDAAGDRGHVELCLRKAAARGVIEVADDGPGMDQEFINTQLFRPFQTTKSTGTGIGAYQTRELVRGMGGELEVESTPGKGTIMRLILPLAPAAA